MGANEWGTPPKDWAGAMPEPILRGSRPTQAMFTKGELYRVVMAESAHDPERVLVGECIAVAPNNILLRTADQGPHQHWMLAYVGMDKATRQAVV